MGSDGKVDMVKGPVEGETDKEVMEAMNKMNLGKAAGLSEGNMDMIIASETFGVGVMKKLCQRVLDGEGMPEEWKTSVVSIFKEKGDVMDCGAYRGIKLLEHTMKKIKELVMIDEMQFRFMSGKGTTHALFILKRMLEKFRGREKKVYILCFVDFEKAFDRVGLPRKVMEWALRKKGLVEVLVQAVMSLYMRIQGRKSELD